MLNFYLSVLETDEDRDKLTAVYEKYKLIMKYCAMKFLHDEGRAEDAVHDAFLRICENLEKISDIDCNKTKAFVVIIVRNICKDMLQYDKRHTADSTDDDEAPLVLTDELQETEAVALGRMGVRKIMELIENMHPNYRDILLLKISYGYDNQQIGEVLNLTQAVVRSRIYRARQQLLELMRKEEMDDEEYLV